MKHEVGLLAGILKYKSLSCEVRENIIRSISLFSLAESAPHDLQITAFK